MAIKTVHVITGLGRGGAEGVLYRLVAASRSLVEQAVISLSDEGVYGPRLRGLGIPVCALGMRRGRISLRGLWKLYRFLLEIKPDVVQTWLYHADFVGGLMARLAGIRRVFWGIRSLTLDHVSTPRTTRMVMKANALLSSWVPEGIVCCSRRAGLVHQALGFAAGKFHIIPNGYELSRFHPDPQERARARRAWGVSEDEALVGLVARWNPLKDHPSLLRALAGLACRCVLVGDGMEKNNLELTNLISRYKLDSRLILAGPRDDIPAVMNALDLHVLSSISEAFPNVVAEALSCGTPCVVTDVGDSALIVGETGWIVPPSDSNALAAAISSALQECRSAPERWQARRQSCRRRIQEKFSMEQMVLSYCQLWRRGPGKRVA
jgi:glycosyltransferase involved in cell wall biosynthesis